MTARGHISVGTKLASALLALGHVPREDAKLMTAAQLISLYNFDHAELHAFTANDHFSNLTPMLIAPHREKSKRDKRITAKAVRIDAANAKHEQARQIGASPAAERRPRQSIPSRPFPKGQRALRSRNTFQRKTGAPNG